MRTDARAVVSQGEDRFLGLFCSLAGGAAVLDQQVEITNIRVKRLFITGSGQSGPDTIPVPPAPARPSATPASALRRSPKTNSVRH